MAEPELVSSAVAVVGQVGKTEHDARMFLLELLAMTRLLRSLDRVSLRVQLTLVLECVQRGLIWPHRSHKTALHNAASALFFLAYSALPRTCLKRMCDWSERSPDFAASVKSMLTWRCVPLHEALLIGGGVDEEAPADDGVLVDRCWASLLAKGGAQTLSLSTSASSSSSSAVYSREMEDDLKQKDDDLKSEMRDLEDQVCELAVAIEAVCARAGVGAFSSVGSLGALEAADTIEDARMEATIARIQLLFEKLMNGKALLQAREESKICRLVPPSGFIGGGGGGGSGGGGGGVAGSGGPGGGGGGGSGSGGSGGGGNSSVSATGASTTDHETTDTSADELEAENVASASVGSGGSSGVVVGGSGGGAGAAAAKLRALLSTARAELYARDGVEEALRRRAHQAEEELRAERERRKLESQQRQPATSDADAALKVQTEQQEQRIVELEAMVGELKERVREQQQFESELGLLQLESAEWDDRAAAAAAARGDGTDSASQLAAAKLEIARLEHTLLEQQTHYDQALAELAGLTAVTNSAMADAQRTDREIEEMRRTLNKMADVYQERIFAVEDKYSSLQELHAGLMLEFSRRK